MENIIKGRVMKNRDGSVHTSMDIHLSDGEAGTTYIIKEISTDDEEMKEFLFTLGCYEGEEVTIISQLADNIVITVKDARYSINTTLAEVIIV